MSTDEVFQMPGLAPIDVQASLAELARARDRVYYDAEADSTAADAYYREIEPSSSPTS